MKRVHKLALLLLFLFLSGCEKLDTPSPQVLWQDIKARQELKKEHFEDALQIYYAIIEADPYRVAPHSNAGIILGMVQKPEESLKSLEHALQTAQQTGDLASEFFVRFNLGVYYGLQKKVPEALEHYQAALEIIPSSKETKHNIELLIQQQQKQDGQNGDQSQENKDKQQGENGKDQKDGKDGSDDKKNKQDNKDQKGDKDQDKKQDDKKDGEDQEKDSDQDKEEKKRENSPKYKPRAFQGEELSEGDVKKILGELRNQEQKIRANFEKKEKGKPQKNEKDW